MVVHATVRCSPHSSFNTTVATTARTMPTVCPKIPASSEERRLLRHRGFNLGFSTHRLFSSSFSGYLLGVGLFIPNLGLSQHHLACRPSPPLHRAERRASDSLWPKAFRPHQEHIAESTPAWNNISSACAQDNRRFVLPSRLAAFARSSNWLRRMDSSLELG